MKLVCYGASVTAQKNESGYVQQLKDLSCAQRFSTIEKVAFGGSQFEYAGYAFMQDVIDLKPDICVIDWLTPSMPSFSEFKIDLLNYTLLKRNCLPIWVFFPRVDNYDSLSPSYQQIQDSARRFNIKFIDLRESILDFSDAPEKYLRDVVHTTLEGAVRYANAIDSVLMQTLTYFSEEVNSAKTSSGYVKSTSLVNPVPTVIAEELKIDSSRGFEICFRYSGGLFELYFDTCVGPHICYLDILLFKAGDLVYETKLNRVDPWCYYNRAMVIDVLRKRLDAGEYRLVIKYGGGNPFSEKETRKPIEEIIIDDDRYLVVNRLSLNVDDCDLTVLDS